MAEQPLERYRAWLSESLHPLVRGWCSDAVRRRYEEASAQFQLRTANEEHSRSYAALCPVPGVDHSSYRLRELSLPGGVSLIAGIHFRGRSTDYPFVGVFAQSRWLATTELATAHAALMREFAVFSPRAKIARRLGVCTRASSGPRSWASLRPSRSRNTPSMPG